MSMLAASAQLSFTELRDTLNLTDGNLTAHIRTLQEAGYVAVTKTFQGSRSLTTFALTDAGKKAFTAYIDLLEQVVLQAKRER
jgi:DNA-binding MarR family transcriptional regulator